MHKLVESTTERRLRNSKDEIVDRLVMPFVHDCTEKLLTNPTRVSDTPKIATQAYNAGALKILRGIDVISSKTKKQTDLRAELDKKINKINIQKPTSIEMLVAVNMIYQG